MDRILIHMRNGLWQQAVNIAHDENNRLHAGKRIITASAVINDILVGIREPLQAKNEEDNHHV